MESRRSYALKIETRSFRPYYHPGYKTRKEAEEAMAMLELHEGWKCSVVYAEKCTEDKDSVIRESYRYVEVPEEGEEG